jgi:TonB family protein
MQPRSQSRIRGPVKTADPQPVLLDSKWNFVKFINPVYPSLAKQARIQSKVQLEVALNGKNGEVTDAKVLSGHPLLNQGALDAARQWVFSPNQNLRDKITVTLEYSIGCKLVQ